ncbi:hypothetical protein [Nocardia noduli]|uniref:hypothetical protein n=1 Tax=Nocardia noduli TaxID=2815722 RepID=UPI001C211281|nr:hypothetical protein [Nocardia noduli]
MAVPVALAATVAGCSGDDTSTTAATSTVVSTSGAPQRTTEQAAEEQGPGVRIAIGAARPVVVPADAIMDIKAPAEWGDAAAGLRCTVTDSTGRNEDLRSSDVKKRETIAGGEWITLWTFSSQPATEVTVGCRDTGNRIPADEAHYIRVTPRGANPN